ncbi:helix-turn-helix domain-containing protein [Streptomyces triticirhizae]|uniref:XRE family transcriptional regulator n=1 Tax=Streptomyces triticirhizae TaxID=2483353 RepID=A0A3M2LRR0_9ACTN|nr:helix-turn-helix transcriptional regulator [Streptomyces triticirhizae]RMI38805.1 XRE family transcriptional regulator [Streptomyces triticirhizae]
MDVTGIGRRLAYWRVRRGMTQERFGAAMGKSRRWVQDIEGGHRQTDPRLSVVELAAEVLGVRLETLLSDQAMRSDKECVDEAELGGIRRTLRRHDVITGAFSESQPVDMGALRRSLAYGWTAFQASDYSPLGRVLSPLLIDATRAAAHSAGDAQQGSYALLALTYQLTVATATKFGDTSLAWHAADRAVIAAQRSGDPVAIVGAARHLCDAMFHQGDCDDAVDFATATAARHEGDLVSGQGISVLGMLYLKAAVAASHADRRDAAERLIDEAATAAARLGMDGNALWTAFGPTNVEIHRVSALVRLHDGVDAVAAAARIEPSGLGALPRERRALHLVDVARALKQAGRPADAVARLLDAEREAPEEVHCRPRAKQLIERLRDAGVGSASWESRLRGLARRCGLPA